MIILQKLLKKYAFERHNKAINNIRDKHEERFEFILLRVLILRAMNK